VIPFFVVKPQPERVVLPFSKPGLAIRVAAEDIDIESTSRTRIIDTRFIYLIVCVFNLVSVLLMIITIIL
jgi:hypothetical protein